MDFITYIKLRDELSYDVVNYVFGMIKKIKMNDIQKEWPKEFINTKKKGRQSFAWPYVAKLIESGNTYCPDETRHFAMYNCWCNERRHHYALNDGWFSEPTLGILWSLAHAKYC